MLFDFYTSVWYFPSFLASSSTELLDARRAVAVCCMKKYNNKVEHKTIFEISFRVFLFFFHHSNHKNISINNVHLGIVPFVATTFKGRFVVF